MTEKVYKIDDRPKINYAGWINNISDPFLLHLDSLFKIGSKREIDIHDLGLLPDTSRTNHVFNIILDNWKNELKLPIEKRSLIRTLRLSLGISPIILGYSLHGFNAATGFAGPMMLKQLLQHLSGENKLPESTLWIFLFILLFAPIFGVLCKEYGNLVLLRLGTKLRGALISFVLRKSCNLTSESRGLNSGTVDNIFVSDTEQLTLIPMFAAASFFAPAQLAIGLALVYQELGPSTFFSIAFLFAIIPIMGICGAGFGFYIKKKLAVADDRIKLTKEIISGIRIIKYFSWELPFSEKIKAFRSLEIKYIICIFACWVGLSAVLESVPVIQPVIIFYAYSKLGNSLTYTKAFTSITLFGLLTGPISQLPGLFQHYYNAKIACDRILKVLNSEERDNYVTSIEHDNESITLNNASFGWINDDNKAIDSNETENEKGYEMVKLTETNPTDDNIQNDGNEKINRGLSTLQNLTFNIDKGAIVACVGSVGSGKSSLIQAILGEMIKKEGTINVNGKVAYHAQQPWIINRSIRENITLGKELDEKKLNDILSVVALDTDIKLLPAGLDTEIGEKGINLSGGQKARLSLARCLYSDADIFLLDDPLAAVDAHTADHLFHVAIKSYLKGKTVLLVTHQVHFLNNCDKVMVISKDGMISAFCKYDEIASNGIELDHLSNIESMVDSTVSGGVNEDQEQDGEDKDNLIRSRTLTSDQPIPENRKRTQSGTKKGLDVEDVHDGSKLITLEEKGEGLVQASVYKFFIRTGGTGVFCLVLLCVFCQKAVYQIALFYLAYWGSVNLRENLSIDENIQFLTTYAWLNTVGVAFAIFRTGLASLHGVKGGLVFHNQMLDRVLRAPPSFFDTTPVGRILNRFTGDIQQSDQGLTALLVISISLLCDCLSGVLAIAISTSGYFLIVVAPIVFTFYRMQHFFRRTNIQIRRLWNVARSPIFTELTASLSCIVSLRSFSIVEQSFSRLEARLDEFMAITYMRFKVGAWLNIRLDSLGALCSFFVAVFTIASTDYGATSLVSAGGMAVSLSYSFAIPTLLSFVMALVTEVEGMMSAIERIKDYAENVPQEEVDKSKYIDVNTQLSPEWPSSGKIVVKNIEMRYRDGPLVLNKVSFTIEDKEKVGIVGRTGSGKSSLLTSIFRFENLYSGQIFIDNVDISTIPLSVLRSRLCIIPQEPVLFCGTLRFNLDPFDEHTDLRLWEVIDIIGLKDMVSSLPKQLLYDIAEGGDNLSVGQRQLVCFGRAILRNPKILFLDESTASVDNLTDSFIQKMIGEKFQNCTILSIAHRLHTIIDSDRVIMLSNGVVCENGNPTVLIKNDGMFAQLWNQYEQAHKKNE